MKWFFSSGTRMGVVLAVILFIAVVVSFYAASFMALQSFLDNPHEMSWTEPAWFVAAAAFFVLVSYLTTLLVKWHVRHHIPVDLAADFSARAINSFLPSWTPTTAAFVLWFFLH